MSLIKTTAYECDRCSVRTTENTMWDRLPADDKRRLDYIPIEEQPDNGHQRKTDGARRERPLNGHNDKHLCEPCRQLLKDLLSKFWTGTT